MGTRARIGIMLPSGAIKSIYTHWDGYPEHHAPILCQHYATLAKARELIKLGSLSVLGETIGDVCDFADHPRGQCVAYARDRGETGQGPKLSKTTESFMDLAADSWGEWVYLFKNGQWWHSEVSDAPVWVSSSSIKVEEVAA